jgi:hypothetical protein
MTQTSRGKQQSAFSTWLRTGRLPSVGMSDGVEHKFNPWHDPADGRFTFAGTGQHYGTGGAGSARRVPGRLGREDSGKSRIEPRPKAGTQRTGRQPSSSERPEGRRATGSRRNHAAEFVGGVGEGLYGVAEGAVESAYAALTTNPATTVRNVVRGAAGMIDKAIIAEDTPARIQISRAADAVADASPREIGRATGSVVGNAALAAVPGAALGKVSTLRRVPQAAPRITYDPPEIGWVKENLGRDTPAKRYNDAATGARPSQAPTLMRTMSDGSKRPVKFDGVENEYVIDRKLKVVDRPRARAQLLRQSEALAQNGLIGTWEVPSPVQRIKALKLLKKMDVTNIKIRVVKP